MKMELTLNKEDIEQIVAEYFKTSVSKIRVLTQTVCRGYGADEHYEAEPKIIVTLDNRKVNE